MRLEIGCSEAAILNALGEQIASVGGSDEYSFSIDGVVKVRI